LSNSGWLFDPGSTESLSQALRVILADESALSAAAANCHDAVSKFSKENWLNRINSILDQVTGKP
jgi:glycosyltransferase involved in cell wall biosynthesis